MTDPNRPDLDVVRPTFGPSGRLTPHPEPARVVTPQAPRPDPGVPAPPPGADPYANPYADPYAQAGYPAPGPYRPGGTYRPAAAHWAAPLRPVRSLAGLARATQVLLVIQMVALGAMLVAVLDRLDLVQRIADGAPVRLSEARHSDDVVAAAQAGTLLLYVATGIVWIVWLYRARTNADAWPGARRRLSSGWAIGGWFCPVVNLWFPYLVTCDVLDASEARGAEPVRRPQRALLVVWWLGFLVLLVSGLVERVRQDPTTVDGVVSEVHLQLADVIIRLVVAVLALLVIRRVTAAQQRRIEGG